MKNYILSVTVVLSLAVFAFVLIWMHRFQYEHIGNGQMLVRINRFTGQGCYFHSDGTWDSRLTLPAKDNDNKLVALDSTGKPYLEDAGINTCQ